MPEQICIPYYPSDKTLIDVLKNVMDKNEKHHIDQNSWGFEFDGKAQFHIGYSDNGLLLKFNVIEEDIRAIYNLPNDPVYKDSCVELFIALNGDENYYNFEFNCKGTCLAGFGKSRNNRTSLDAKNIRDIESSASFKSTLFNGKSMVKWDLTLLIPKSAFQFHKITSFENKSAKLNVYKCGDDLPKPHYLSWNPITNVAEPNFHLPEFFATAIFQ